MDVLWLTFRLQQDAGYQARYDRLMDAVHAHAVVAWWAEPTSFWLFGSSSSMISVAATVKGAINPHTDLVLIGSMEYKGAVVVGSAEHPDTLRQLIPEMTTA